MTVYECLISTSDFYMTGNNSNIPSITDWLMVGITVVYVIATVFICWANFSSARASKAQVEESKRQYEETKRLQMMPYIKNLSQNYRRSGIIIKNRKGR